MNVTNIPRIRCGSVFLRPLPVDDYGPGACDLIVLTPEGWAYSDEYYTWPEEAEQIERAMRWPATTQWWKLSSNSALCPWIQDSIARNPPNPVPHPVEE